MEDNFEGGLFSLSNEVEDRDLTPISQQSFLFI